MEKTPQSLLEQLRHRPDGDAWSRLVDLYTPLIQRWVRGYGVAASDVDDLVQEVLAVLVREVPVFEHNQQRGAFRCWLRTVVVNRVRGYWRHRRSGTANVADGELLDEIADPNHDPDRQWEREHDEFILRRALEQLRPELTDSTWLAFHRQLAGATPAQVAAELGLSPNAVVLAKFRVLRRLRQHLRGILD